MLPKHTAARLLGRDVRGFALPMALIALVLISVLVTGVLLSSTTEVALSSAHRDATAALYKAEGAIEAFIAAEADAFRAGTVTPGARDAWQVPDGGRADINITRISRTAHPALAGEFVDLYSVTASPAGGGRTVTAMLEASPFTLGVDQAATFGGDSKIQGNFLVSDGSDTQGLAEGTRSCVGQPGSSAIVHADGTDVTYGRDNVHGEIVESDLSSDDLIRETLGGHTIREFAAFVQRQKMPSANFTTFGRNTLWGSSPAFTGNGQDKPRWHDGKNPPVVRPLDNPYNWYCPGRMETATQCYNYAAPGATRADTTTYKYILVDAGGTEITIQGDHGQGVLMVLNGGIRISGGFTFRGMILSEKDIDISGNGNKVEGAIISRNEVRVDRPNDSDSELTGTAVVRFNRCTINAIMEDLNPPSGANRQLRLTSAWSELVR